MKYKKLNKVGGERMLLSFTSYFLFMRYKESLCDTRNLYAIQGIFMRYKESICDTRNLYAIQGIFMRYKDFFYTIYGFYPCPGYTSVGLEGIANLKT